MVLWAIKGYRYLHSVVYIRSLLLIKIISLIITLISLFVIACDRNCLSIDIDRSYIVISYCIAQLSFIIINKGFISASCGG